MGTFVAPTGVSSGEEDEPLEASENSKGIIEFQSPLDVFEKTLEHERKVTAMIHNLYALAVQEKHYASQVFLQWLVTERVEEENSATQIVETVKRVGDKSHALLMLDRELGRRE